MSTCDGSSVPDEHADPVETATPARSSAIRSDSASTRSKLMLVVFGTRAPRVPLIANVLASEISDPAAIKQRLVEQVTGLVRWRESVQYMKSKGIEALVECGTGKVLSGLVKRIDKDMTGMALNGPGDIEAFLKTV